MPSRSDTVGVTVTNTILLEGLRNTGDHSIWQRYVDRYRPLVIRYAQRLGVPREDAEDIAQQTLVGFATSYRRGTYERDKGRLRDWLFGITRNQVMNWFRRRPRREVQAFSQDSDATGLLARVGEAEALHDVWEQEWRDAVVRESLEQVRREVQPGTYEAFELFACRGWTAERVAEHLDITPNAVFGAKRRVLERIRMLRATLEEAW